MHRYFAWFLGVAVLLFAEQLPLSATPTERFLASHPIEEFSESFDPLVIEYFPLLIEISKEETEETFFGYHATSQNSRLFQDILRVVFEEVLDHPLPENFYFLRSPGKEEYNAYDGQQSFLEKNGELEFPNGYQEAVLKNFIALAQKQSGDPLSISDFSQEEKKLLWDYFESFIDVYTQDQWVRTAKKYSLPESAVLEEKPFNEQLPTVVDTIVKRHHELYPDSNSGALKAWMEAKLSDSYDIYTVFNQRELPPEEKVNERLIDRLVNPYDDTAPHQQALLVSLNVPLFANSSTQGCFSPEIFLLNESMLGGDECLENELKELFAEIGLDPAMASLMWEEGIQYLRDAGADKGCLLQLFDLSAAEGGAPFSFADAHAFVSFRHGIPMHGLTPSAYIMGSDAMTQGSKDLELRLVMGNQSTLNPHSPLRMVRHDLISREASEGLIEMLKARLRGAACDAGKKQQYLVKLEILWGT